MRILFLERCVAADYYLLTTVFSLVTQNSYPSYLFTARVVGMGAYHQV